jgi:DNA (cytosine-5)-methyltransferase 1
MKVLDLFSGIGGFSYGLEKIGFKTVAFCEIDKFCKLLLQKHWKGVKIYNDVKEITKQRLETDGIELPEVITGGFPCQPFSIAGKQKGTSDDRHLWPEMFRIIQEFTPRWVVGENVRGLVNIQDGMVFETVCTDLEGEGYEVRAFNIPAAGVGAPHRRERIFVIANAESQGTRKNEPRLWQRTGGISGRQGTNQNVEDTRRTLRQGSLFEETNENEIRQRNADINQRPSRPSEFDVADAKSLQGNGRRRHEHPITEQGPEQTGGTSGSMANAYGGRSAQPSNEIQAGWDESSYGGENVADADKTRLQGFGTEHQLREGQSEESTGRIGWWESEPDVGRVAHGVSGRVHRLKALGNAIVPQIAEEIGKAILKAERAE